MALPYLKKYYRPMNQGTIRVKVYPEGIQSVKGNNCGLIPTIGENTT